ncbi:sulfur oxidation c-type cytochrome SoxX [Mesorhizobium xinjiangense]|uniref:sulfur oxidation c-type cytochrome SoxX n=1 Tax=Mesorhizobium xinjiangense TaxID=2678685 RepID=UPI0012EE922D|nr:sulfur oxidation c-type cytochrome SoxX [Mesorhizobium xinjiangense]
MKLAKISLAAAVFMLPASIASAGDVVPPDEVMYEDFTVEASLSGASGNPDNGAEIFKNRKLGNCLACHINSAMQEELFHGTVGPSLDDVGSRWEPAQLRAIVADAKEMFGEQTVMPGFYSLSVGVNVAEDRVGKTILRAQQVEDVVAYLATLKE